MRNFFRGIQFTAILGLSLLAFACSNSQEAAAPPPPVQTQGDLTGPTIVSTTPSNGGVLNITNSSTQEKTLTVTFSEPVTNLVAGNITLTDSYKSSVLYVTLPGQSIGPVSTVTENVPVTVTIDPTNNTVVTITATISTGRNYTLAINAGAVTDLAGNQYQGGNNGTFIAQEIMVDPIPSDPLNTNAMNAD